MYNIIQKKNIKEIFFIEISILYPDIIESNKIFSNWFKNDNLY